MDTVETLKAKYGDDGEHPGRGLTRDDWEADRFTRMPYWEWVRAHLELEAMCAAIWERQMREGIL
jgi:hypothetical protein